MTRIFLTGGGTAGHVTPNLALLPHIRQAFPDSDIHYIGSENGIEKELISKYPDITYHPIRTGKLRRYMSLKNFTDIFRVIGGYSDSKKLVKELKPDFLFSKGGFVSVPICAAAAHYKVPIVSHESDITPGLANKLTKSKVTKICVTFPDTLANVGTKKGVYTGSPIRSDLLTGDREKARKELGFDSKPVVLMMGGSLGSKNINACLRKALPELLKDYNIIHLCGKGNLCDNAPSGYKQFEFVSEQLPDYLALADLIISRAGSNSIHEFLALHKPMLLIPLPLSASRGDQILNARSFSQRGFASVLEEEKMNPSTLAEAIKELDLNKEKYILAMTKEPITNGTLKIMEVILTQTKQKSS